MYDLGDTVTDMWATVKDAAGAPTNAATVVLTIYLPDGTTATPAVTNPPVTTGVYGLDYVPTLAGPYGWNLKTTGPSTALSGSFNVWPAAPVGIISLADAKSQLNIAAATTTHDEELRTFIGASTAVVERHTGKTVVRRTVTDYHDVSGSVLLLDHRPVISLTSVATYDAVTTWNVADLHLDGELGRVTVKTGARLAGYLQAVYVAGMSLIPANYLLAGSMIVQHLWETQRGTRGGPRPGGMDDSMTVVMGYAIPNRALELLGASPPLVA